MNNVLIRLFPIQQNLRDRCIRALAADPALQIIDAQKAQVAVLDVADDSLDRHLCECRAVHPLLLSPDSARETCVSALLRGAHGLLRHDEIEAELAPAVRHMASGRLWFPVTAVPAFVIFELLRAHRHWVRLLTGQEGKVALLASRGLANKEIGNALTIAPSTVAFHLRNIFKKLAIHSRRQIASAR